MSTTTDEPGNVLLTKLKPQLAQNLPADATHDPHCEQNTAAVTALRKTAYGQGAKINLDLEHAKSEIDHIPTTFRQLPAPIS